MVFYSLYKSSPDISDALTTYITSDLNTVFNLELIYLKATSFCDLDNET